MIGFLQTTQRLPTLVDLTRLPAKGWKKPDYIEGRNVAVEYRWVENQNDRRPP